MIESETDTHLKILKESRMTAMVTLQESIEEKYGEKESEAEDFGFIVFVSCSPEAKAGMFPPLMTLNDYNIECFGDFSDLYSKVRHVRELDLTDNLLSDWSEIINIMSCFKSLSFLNLSNNMLSEPLDDNNNEMNEKLENSNLPMRKVIQDTQIIQTREFYNFLISACFEWK